MGDGMETKNEFAFFKKGFLILKRTAGQGMKIGDDIEIEIARVENGVVYVAVSAPNKKVLRNEIAKNEPRPKQPDAAPA